jgi:hypothetical protein
MIIIHKHRRLDSLPHQDLPTTQTLHSKSSISALLSSLLPLEGFYDFLEIKFLQQVLDKILSPSSHMSLI